MKAGARVELNIDLGELPGEPEELYALATVANVACGGHAGDGVSMQRAVESCIRRRTRLAAHPSYPDRDGFGRRTLELAPARLRASLDEQLSRLAAIAASAGVRISALKPHGALYHRATRDASLARLLADATIANCGPLALVGEAGGQLELVARERGLPFLREAFADRGYDASGRMLPRAAPGALIDDPRLASEQALRFVEAGAIDTLCVHGDTPNAVAIARSVHEALASRALLGARERDSRAPEGEAKPP